MARKKGILLFLKRKTPLNKAISILIALFSVTNILASFYLVISFLSLKGLGIIITLGGSALSILFALLLTAISFNTIVKEKKLLNVIFIFFILISITSNILISYNINQIYEKLTELNKTETLYTTNLITLASSNVTKDTIKDMKIGIINDKENIEGYLLPQKLIKEYNLEKDNTLITYNEFPTMLNDLYSGDVDLIFVSSNYILMFRTIETFKDIETNTKPILTLEELQENIVSLDQSKTKSVKEPFTLLITGVDSKYDGLDTNASFNGDALMLLTFNPNTLNATMLSIPRDTYVPIACLKDNLENKITHSAWYGEDCVMNTIEDFTGINIDYYIKINFKGVVDLVDTLGGIDIDVPIKFCEQNSNRDWGSDVICLEKGMQHLNGEEALALSRHRKTIPNGDIGRGLNQQLVIDGIMQSSTEINSLNKMYDLLDAITKNMETNMTVDQILSFYNVGIDILSTTNNKIPKLEQLFLKGYGVLIYDKWIKLPLYNYVPYEGSIADIVEAMKINLEIKKPDLIKELSFSIKEPYETKLIGNDYYGKHNYYPVVHTMSKKTKAEAIAWADSNGFEIVFEEVSIGDELYSDTYKDEEIIGQDIHPFTRIQDVETKIITVKIIDKYVPPIEPEPLDCSLEENQTDSTCLLPDLIGYTVPEFDSWLNSLTITLSSVKTIILTTDGTYDETKAGLVISQDIEAGTLINNLDEGTITITYMEETPEEEE